jgi:hypothetical protein
MELIIWTRWNEAVERGMWGGIWLGPERGGVAAAVTLAEGKFGTSGGCDDMVEMAIRVDLFDRGMTGIVDLQVFKVMGFGQVVLP